MYEVHTPPNRHVHIIKYADIHLGLTNDFPPCPVVCLVEDDAPVNRTEDLGTVDGDANTLGFGSIWICGSSRRVIK